MCLNSVGAQWEFNLRIKICENLRDLRDTACGLSLLLQGSPIPCRSNVFNVSSMYLHSVGTQFPAEAMGNSCSAMGKPAAQCPAEAIGVQFQNKDMRDLRDTPCAFKSNL